MTVVTPELVAQLRQRKNMSVDPAKTMARFGELWKSSKNLTKNQIIDLAATGRPSIHSAYKTGRLSPKVALVSAQFFGVNPLYLTGENDERGLFSYETARFFLKKRGFPQAMDLLKNVSAEEADAEDPGNFAPAPAAAPLGSPSNLTSSEAVTLLESLVIRSRFDPVARDKLLKVFGALLS